MACPALLQRLNETSIKPPLFPPGIDPNLRFSLLFAGQTRELSGFESIAMIQKLSMARSLGEGLYILEKEGVKVSSYILKKLLELQAPWQSKIRVFAFAPKESLHICNFCLFIRLAGKAKDCKSAQIVFEEGMKRNFPTEIQEPIQQKDSLAGHFLMVAAKCRRMDLARIVYNDAKRDGYLGDNVISSYIQAEGKYGDFEKAQRVYEEASGKEDAKATLYAYFLIGAFKNRKVDAAEQAFRRAKETVVLECRTYIKFMRGLGELGEYFRAKRVFEEAKSLWPEVGLYNAFMKLAYENGYCDDAKEAFFEAKRRGIADSQTLAHFIFAANISRDYPALTQAFEEAMANPLFRSEWVFSAYIEAMGLKNDIEAARSAFHTAYEFGLDQPLVYLNMIIAERRMGNIQRADALFDEAIRFRIFTHWTMVSLILNAGKRKELPKAIALFEMVKKQGFLTSTICNAFINAQGRNGDVDGALQTFQLAQKKGMANDSTQKNYEKVLRRNAIS